jgi:hypothetical protein
MLVAIVAESLGGFRYVILAELARVSAGACWIAIVAESLGGFRYDDLLRLGSGIRKHSVRFKKASVLHTRSQLSASNNRICGYPGSRQPV